MLKPPDRGADQQSQYVTTIARVAIMLGEDEDWLGDVVNEMDQEDGLIWVYGPGDYGVMSVKVVEIG